MKKFLLEQIALMAKGEILPVNEILVDYIESLDNPKIMHDEADTLSL